MGFLRMILAATVVAFAALPSTVFSSQSGTDSGTKHKKPGIQDEHMHGGDFFQDGCPSPEALTDYLVANNLQAHFSNDGMTSTYTFGSSVTGETPVGGVPGLIKYCVYPIPAMQAVDTTVTAVGANGTPWISSVGSSNFSFGRPDGDPSNISLDGSNTVMGTATWNTLPGDQTILLQIKDPEVCADLYGKEKRKHHKNLCDDGGKGNHGTHGKEVFTKNDKYAVTGNEMYSGKGDKEKDKTGKDEKGKQGEHNFELAGTCFVKPSPGRCVTTATPPWPTTRCLSGWSTAPTQAWAMRQRQRANLETKCSSPRARAGGLLRCRWCSPALRAVSAATGTPGTA